MSAKTLLLVGECNKCGLCCFMQEYKCDNLEVTGKVGQSEATRCGVYDKRYNGMPITMHDKKGNVVYSYCLKESVEETLAIVEKGIGKGCSLRFPKEGE